MARLALLNFPVLCGCGNSRPGNRHRYECCLGAVVLLAHQWQPADPVYLPAPFQTCSGGHNNQTSGGTRPTTDNGTSRNSNRTEQIELIITPGSTSRGYLCQLLSTTLGILLPVVLMWVVQIDEPGLFISISSNTLSSIAR